MEPTQYKYQDRQARHSGQEWKHTMAKIERWYQTAFQLQNAGDLDAAEPLYRLAINALVNGTISCLQCSPAKLP